MTNGVEETEIATVGNIITNFNPETLMDKIQSLLVDYGIDILIAIIISIVGKFIVKAICKFVKKSLKKAGKLNDMLVSFLTNILNALLMAFVFISVLSQLGIKTTSLAVVLGVRVWVNTADYWTVLFDMQEQIKKTFDANDVSIPFPQTDVHLYKSE